MTLESIVRPFQSPWPLARVRTATVVSSGDAPGPAILTWGAAGTVPDGAQQDGIDPYENIPFTTACCRDVLTQKSRKTEKKRIDASDGSGFFVEFERPFELDMHLSGCSEQAKSDNIVIAPIDNLFTPDGRAVYGVTDNRTKKDCNNLFKYSYND